MKSKLLRILISAAAAALLWAATVAVYYVLTYKLKISGIYNFEWTFRSGLYIPVAVFSILMAALGRYYLAGFEYLGCLTGWIFGDMCVFPASEGAVHGGSYQGAIWCWYVILIFPLLGGLAEIIWLLKRKNVIKRPDNIHIPLAVYVLVTAAAAAAAPVIIAAARS